MKNLTLLITGSGALFSAANALGQERPLNIVYIMCDDHSYQTISAYGSSVNHTPNIDRLAERGVRFTNSFVANSLSGPSRACMLTGKHSHTNGFTDNTKRFDGSQQTFPKLLQQAGYQTAMIGKWHLVSQPTGFDYWDILTGQGDYYNPTFIRNGERLQRHGYSTTLVTDLAIDWLSNKRDPQKPFCLLMHHKAPHRTWMPDLQDLELFSDSTYTLPSNFYDDYSGRQAAKEQRMSIAKDMDVVYDLKMADRDSTIHSFDSTLELWGYAMYTQRMDSAQQAAWDAHYQPIIAEFKEQFGDKMAGEGLTKADSIALNEWKYRQYMRDYLRVIHGVDRSVGRILDYLEQNGLLENTLVVYTSDQGFYMGEHGWFDKRFMYEESFRTPLIMSLPGGRVGTSDAMVQNIDYAPTFLEAAGVPVPKDIQGESLLCELQVTQKAKSGSSRDRMKESTKTRTRNLYYHYYEYPDEHRVNRHFGIRTPRYSLMRFYGDVNQWELYDLKRDPQNMHNLYGQPGTLSLTRKLKKKLLQLQILYDDPIRHTVKDYDPTVIRRRK